MGYEGMLDLLKRIKESKQKLIGDLEFANDWEYFTQDPDNHFEQLTSTGPFAGTLEAFTTGVKLRTRYSHLLGDSGVEKMRLWGSDSDRVIDTARYFSAGLFGLDWQHAAELIVIPEAADLGADTLTPTATCSAYLRNLTFGHDYGARMLERFQSTYLGLVGDRLQEQNPHMHFNDSEIYSMQEMCGFETTVRGSSKWCDVFTRADWLNFEYARDVIHYYRSGPSGGNQRESDIQISTHDSDIISMISTLDIFIDSQGLPTDRILTARNWRTSQMTPMGGRVIFERLTCSEDSGGAEQSYLRININDGIVEIPHCSTGPGSSCPLEKFVTSVMQKGKELGDFREKCHLTEDLPDRITFLHQ
ncbi:hypothetical protein FGG08_002464 [Glutinoglossum americanum]|uniref:Acid phosphatase n=1 Tax=Glutinoglossum americanum TaxID=1670608 RepID=A0A9P8I686_9PEZI|nr:hypothetical protein FGG08_002464 [Glutinoglossum americanum]